MNTAATPPEILESGLFRAPACAQHLHVVLVETKENLNIGSVARAMKNLGFGSLHLVAPKKFDRTRAAITACHATDLLDSLVIHDTMESALAPMAMVVGLSVRSGKHRVTPLILPHWVPEWHQSEPRATALVFGPEDTGLQNEHLEHCTRTMRIPTAAEYSSFNLAQAVVLTLSEFTRHEWIGQEVAATPCTPQPASNDLPTWNEFYHLDRLVESTLTTSGFYRKGSPEPVPATIKNMFRRIAPNRREMGILLALFSRVEKSLRMNYSKQSPSLEAPSESATLETSEHAQTCAKEVPPLE